MSIFSTEEEKTTNNIIQAPSVGNWNGLLLSNDTPAGISFGSASALLNASEVPSLFLYFSSIILHDF